MGLELYGKIEPLLGFEEEAGRFYRLHIQILSKFPFKTLLDIGCGNGLFLKQVMEALPLKRALGVDLSETMVERARRNGIEARHIDICDLQERFDAATAVFDVLNYIPPEGLERFFDCTADLLEKEGLFVADVNTLLGFEEVAPGTLVRNEENAFLSVDADFEAGRLTTRFDLFEKRAKNCWHRTHDTVVQYHHPLDRLVAQAKAFTLVETIPVALYADEPDKNILVFQRR